MKRLLSALLALSSLALASGALAAEPNTLTPEEGAAGWKLLFDGHSLSGWRSLSGPAPGSGWAAEDGSIVRTGKSGDLLTTAEYGNFELSIEWKVADETNSGILYRVATTEKQTYFTGPEYQILDNVRGGDRFAPKHRAAALYDLVAPPADWTAPVGSWNQTRIVVAGWHVEHWLNGHKVVDVDLASPEGRALIAKSKFAVMPHFAQYSSGHIALQDHDGAVWYRSIKIRELPHGP